MRIITLNANSIRSAGRKDFFTWMQQQNTDIICIQKNKSPAVSTQFRSIPPCKLSPFYHAAEKRL